jgi:hypothetical protein
MEIQFLHDCISGVSSLYVVPVMSLFSVTDDATYCTLFKGQVSPQNILENGAA